MKMNYGRLLVLVALVSTPAAMVVFLTLEISGSVQVPDSAIWSFVIVAGAFLSSVGIESTGILSGHALERFVRRQEWIRASVVFILLIVYTAVAMRILWANEMLRYVPLVAAVVYILAGLIEGVEAVEADEARLIEFDLAEKAKNNELERELKRRGRLDKTAVRLAQIETNGNQPTKPRNTKPETAKQPVASLESLNLDDMNETRRAVYETTKRNPDATQQEIADIMAKTHGISISRQMVGKHQRALNGALK